ncbi:MULTISPECIES: DUF551 domain-containing protein [unclassified Bradyrhizobium]|uniref:DUF551 domain-containing protein n=1 Tax=unclassified Bradyrhizobium TaxID=2631580 RepID=UPI0028E5CB11|nr:MULTISPECIES: DUF551 domain-containing protein [unclassified Bradyrhizobium]
MSVIKLHPKDYEALMDTLAAPPEPNEALRRLLNNETVLDRLRGVQAQPGTPETDADPRNHQEAALSGDSQWQPIETAPKDGAPILAYTPDGLNGPVQAVVYWYVHKGERFLETDIPEFYRREEWEHSWWEGAGFSPFRATHWMPLPAPPVAI